MAHAKSVDARTEGDGWQCFGGSGLDGDRATYIGAWAPGHAETLIGDRTGYRLEPVAGPVVLQVHYDLLAINGKTGPTDQSSIRLRLAPGTADVTPLVGSLPPAPIGLPCTSEESGPPRDRETAIADLVKRHPALRPPGSPPRAAVRDHPAPAPAGRSITVERNPGTPTAQTLLDQPAYNFDDQSERVLPQPVQLDEGDTVRVTRTHDASLRAQLPQLKNLKPRYVVWGDGTSDEMCLAILTVTTEP